MKTELSPHVAAVQQWLAEFVLQPHPALGRQGPVCPFLGPAARQGSLVFTERKIGMPATRELLANELLDCARSFDELEWPGPNRRLDAMIALFPELTDAEAAYLHHAHNEIKEGLLHRDIMMSPFHPGCHDRAARNDDLFTFRSPVPMVAIRRLAFHDILFLYQERERFLHYARRFGKRFRRPAALDPVLVERYRDAVELHGDPNLLQPDGQPA